jgi:hypothetical protein
MWAARRKAVQVLILERGRGLSAHIRTIACCAAPLPLGSRLDGIALDHDFRKSSGSFAILVAIHHASSSLVHREYREKLSVRKNIKT